MRYLLMLATSSMSVLASSAQVLAQTAPPTITLTQPSGALTVVAGANVLLTASASPSSGTTIATGYFYQGTTAIGRFRSGPYQMLWAPPTAGTYSVYAIATDSNGVTATSAAQ